MTKPSHGPAPSKGPSALSKNPPSTCRETPFSLKAGNSSSRCFSDALSAGISVLAAESIGLSGEGTAQETPSGTKIPVPPASFFLCCALLGASLEDEDPKALFLRLRRLSLPTPEAFSSCRDSTAAVLGLICAALGRLGAMGSPWDAPAAWGSLSRMTAGEHPAETDAPGQNAAWNAASISRLLEELSHDLPFLIRRSADGSHPVVSNAEGPASDLRGGPRVFSAEEEGCLKAAARLLLLAEDSPLCPGREARRLFRSGGLEAVNRALGRPYTLEGSIVHGRALGRTVGMPTANLLTPEGALLPPHGVYATLFRFGGQTLRGLTNVGPRPSVGGEQVTVETFLPDFKGDLYGQSVLLEFHGFIRGIFKMKGLDEVHRQVQRDVFAAEAILGREGL